MRNFLFVVFFIIILGGCGSDPERVVITVPLSGPHHQVGDAIYTGISQGFKGDDNLILSRGDSGCSYQQGKQLAEEIVASEVVTQLVIGPYCYEAWLSATPVLREKGIAQLPLIPAMNWDSYIEEETDLMAKFVIGKLQSKSTLIAYVANEYGNAVSEKLQKKLQGITGVKLLPLANILQTAESEVQTIVSEDPTTLIIISHYPKAKALIEGALSFGLNSVIVLGNTTQPSLLLKDISSRRLRRARFVAAINSPEQASDLIGAQSSTVLTMLAHLLKNGKVDKEAINNLPKAPPLKMVYINRDGNFNFESGL